MLILSFKELIQKSNIKYTQKKESILRVLSMLQKPVCIEELYKEVNKNQKIDRATVYRAITQFKEHNIVNEISFNGTSSYFEFVNNNSFHPHFRCQICGVLECLAKMEIKQIQEIKKISNNYDIKNINLSVEGICQSCKKE